jgi:hypothetical protein
MNATFTNKEASFTQTPIPYPTLFRKRVSPKMAKKKLLETATYLSQEEKWQGGKQSGGQHGHPKHQCYLVQVRLQ